MKRLVAVCIVAGVLLATSTAAFATPITGTWTWNAPAYDNTVSSGFTTTSASDRSYTITWSQPYSNPTAPTLPTMAALGFDPAGTLTWSAPVITIDSATLTMATTGVNETGEPVWRGTSSSSWAAQIGTMVPSAPWPATNSTTVLTLADANTWLAPTGFWVQYRAPASDQQGSGLNTVNSSRLQVSAHWDYGYSYEPPTQPPIPPAAVPAPGAILLASLGAGLVSWLRSRKAL